MGIKGITSSILSESSIRLLVEDQALIIASTRRKSMKFFWKTEKSLCGNHVTAV